MNMNKYYEKEDALALKGLAIIKMIHSHCFMKDRFDGYYILY